MKIHSIVCTYKYGLKMMEGSGKVDAYNDPGLFALCS